MSRSRRLTPGRKAASAEHIRAAWNFPYGFAEEMSLDARVASASITVLGPVLL